MRVHNFNPWRKILNDDALFFEKYILLSPVLNELETSDLAQSNRDTYRLVKTNTAIGTAVAFQTR